jgi:hypothetical protein
MTSCVMTAAWGGAMETHRKLRVWVALRGSGEGTTPRGSTTGLPTGTESTPPDAMAAGRDAAMLVAPVHEALKQPAA